MVFLIRVFFQLYSLKVDRLEKPKRPEDLQKDGREDWTGCQADAIEHLCSEVRIGHCLTLLLCSILAYLFRGK